MNPDDWLSSTNPGLMLQALPRWPGSLRRRRLLACACARRVWGWMDPPWQRAVEQAELYADGKIKQRDMLARRPQEKSLSPANAVAFWASETSARVNSDASLILFHHAASASTRRDRGIRYLEDHAAQAGLVRDIFGLLRESWPLLITPPWRLSIDPAVLTPTVVSLAHAAYDHRLLPSGQLDPYRLKVLADALEDAEADQSVLDHLRGRGSHVRGCHLVDAILNRS